MKTIKNNRTHCVIKGCGGFKLKDDERCLTHVRMRYLSYWSRGNYEINRGAQKGRVSIDTIDKSRYNNIEG